MPPFDVKAVRGALLVHPPRRMSPRGHRRAAVAAILTERAAGPEVLLIKRSEQPGDRWSGHMAFPGGLEEPTDADLEATARRETLEEVGLDLARHGELLGRLDDIRAIARGRPTGMVITPFVFAVSAVPALELNDEVAETLWAPLGPMARGEIDAVRRYEHEGRVMDLPAFDVEGRIVWGLTYQMLRALLSTIAGSSDGG